MSKFNDKLKHLSNIGLDIDFNPTIYMIEAKRVDGKVTIVSIKDQNGIDPHKSIYRYIIKEELGLIKECFESKEKDYTGQTFFYKLPMTKSHIEQIIKGESGE